MMVLNGIPKNLAGDGRETFLGDEGGDPSFSRRAIEEEFRNFDNNPFGFRLSPQQVELAEDLFAPTFGTPADPVTDEWLPSGIEPDFFEMDEAGSDSVSQFGTLFASSTHSVTREDFREAIDPADAPIYMPTLEDLLDLRLPCRAFSRILSDALAFIYDGDVASMADDAGLAERELELYLSGKGLPEDAREVSNIARRLGLETEGLLFAWIYNDQRGFRDLLKKRNGDQNGFRRVEILARTAAMISGKPAPMFDDYLAFSQTVDLVRVVLKSGLDAEIVMDAFSDYVGHFPAILNNAAFAQDKFLALYGDEDWTWHSMAMKLVALNWFHRGEVETAKAILARADSLKPAATVPANSLSVSSRPVRRAAGLQQQGQSFEDKVKAFFARPAGGGQLHPETLERVFTAVSSRGDKLSDRLLVGRYIYENRDIVPPAAHLSFRHLLETVSARGWNRDEVTWTSFVDGRALRFVFDLFYGEAPVSDPAINIPGPRSLLKDLSKYWKDKPLSQKFSIDAVIERLVEKGELNLDDYRPRVKLDIKGVVASRSGVAASIRKAFADDVRQSMFPASLESARALAKRRGHDWALAAIAWADAGRRQPRAVFVDDTKFTPARRDLEFLVNAAAMRLGVDVPQIKGKPSIMDAADLAELIILGGFSEGLALERVAEFLARQEVLKSGMLEGQMDQFFTVGQAYFIKQRHDKASMVHEIASLYAEKNGLDPFYAGSMDSVAEEILRDHLITRTISVRQKVAAMRTRLCESAIEKLTAASTKGVNEYKREMLQELRKDLRSLREGVSYAGSCGFDVVTGEWSWYAAGDHMKLFRIDPPVEHARVRHDDIRDDLKALGAYPDADESDESRGGSVGLAPVETQTEFGGIVYAGMGVDIEELAPIATSIEDQWPLDPTLGEATEDALSISQMAITGMASLKVGR